ncbi:NAD(P)/FAD-dependent oxidoreductase [Candidatus Gracilibacteria bacterium]|nr:NAD(P)/FAD-dependent oxidoreductase [Candidatus Gracilibacteria bacterium]
MNWPTAGLACSPAARARLDKVQLLLEWSKQLTFFTNGALMLTPEERARLVARGITIIDTPVVEVVGAGRSVEALRLSDNAIFPLDGLFISPTTRLATPFAEQLGCAIEAGPLGPVISTDSFKATTVPGLYAAGDAARAMHNISLAVADGVIAGAMMHRSLVF